MKILDERYQDWVSSKDVMDSCGISRATLNNYIKLGIIQKPVVLKPRKGMEGTKKIGYFPPTVLERISKVKQLKQEGNSVINIVKKLKEKKVQKTQENVIAERIEADKTPVLNSDVKAADKTYLDANQKVTISIDDIKSPAYLINNKFEIEWINSEAEELIFKKDVKSIRNAESRNVFKLFFNWEFNSAFQNWKNIIDFHMSFVKSKNTRDYISNIYTDITDSETALLGTSYDGVTPVPKELIRESYLNIIKSDGSSEPYRVYTSFFREGLLFVYVPVNSFIEEVTQFLSGRENVIKDLLQKRLPTMVSFCVLFADLQNSVRICAELPPEEYFELINQIWKTMESSFRKYYGIFGKHAGDGIVYYFLKEQNSNYIVNSIRCAMEIKEKMEVISAEWKARKKWYNDLYLNIGINEGLEYFSTVNASTSMEFMALGDTINYAGRLSDLARYGSILTTKNLINNLKDEDRKKMRFGVSKKMEDREMFVENVFSRVTDMISENDMRRSKFSDIATLPVTEIVGINP
jgi:class 3 adenylate cyclase